MDGTSRRDVIQGVLGKFSISSSTYKNINVATVTLSCVSGDCWLLSTCAALAKKEELLYRVISPGQVLYGGGYNGMVMVKLWRYGEWITVVIDDR